MEAATLLPFLLLIGACSQGKIEGCTEAQRLYLPELKRYEPPQELAAPIAAILTQKAVIPVIPRHVFLNVEKGYTGLTFRGEMP